MIDVHGEVLGPGIFREDLVKKLLDSQVNLKKIMEGRKKREKIWKIRN